VRSEPQNQINVLGTISGCEEKSLIRIVNNNKKAWITLKVLISH